MAAGAMRVAAALAAAAGIGGVRAHPEDHTHHAHEQSATDIPLQIPSFCVVLIVIVAALQLTALIAVVLRRQSTLAAIMCVFAWWMLPTVGVASWSVTYVTASKVIRQRTQMLLTRAARAAMDHVEKDFAAGTQFLETQQNYAAMNFSQMGNSFPIDHLVIGAQFNSLRNNPTLRVSQLVYYGTNDTRNTAIGSALVGLGTIESDEGNAYVLLLQPEPSAATPSFITCPAQDRDIVGTGPAAEVCPRHFCGSNAALDFQCQKTCADRATMGMPGVPVDPDGPFPPSSAKYCEHAAGESSTRLGLYAVRFNPANGGSFDPYYPSDSYMIEDLFTYAPDTRPWWTDSRVPRFNDPYTSAGENIGVAITMSVGMYDENDEFVACSGIDFTLARVQPVLQSLKPTPNTHIFLADEDYRIFGSSMTTMDMAADTGFAPEEVVRADAIVHKNSTVRRAFASVIEAYGTRATRDQLGLTHEIYHASMVDATADHVIMAFPFEANGKIMLLALILPYRDAMAEADEASVRSLAVTISLSVCASAVMFGLVALLLRPLRALEASMYSVACMQLEMADPAPSRVAEVQNMQVSFMAMLALLRGYRDFLPETVLMNTALGGDASDSGCSDGAVPDKVSRGSSLSLDRPDSAASTNECTSVRSVSSGHSAHTSVAASVVPASAAPMIPILIERTNALSVAVVGKKLAVVTVMFRYLSHVLAADPAGAIASHTEAIALVLETAKHSRGVVDGMQGSTVTLLFNSHRPQGTFKTAATTCAVDVVQKLEARRTGRRLAVSCGLSAGTAKVGNMGCTGLKKFNVVGHVPRYAWNYAHLAARWRLGVVGEENILRDCRMSVETRYICRVCTPDIVTASAAMLSEVVGTTTPEVTEWMYQVAEVGASPYRRMDAAFELLFDAAPDACAEANKIMEKVETALLPPPALLHYERLRLCIDGCAEAVPLLPLQLDALTVETNLALTRYAAAAAAGDLEVSCHGTPEISMHSMTGSKPSMQRLSVSMIGEAWHAPSRVHNPLTPRGSTSRNMPVHPMLETPVTPVQEMPLASPGKALVG